MLHYARNSLVTLSCLLAPLTFAHPDDYLSLSLHELINMPITAQKRPQRLQDVPLSMSLLPRERIDAANLLRIDEIANIDSSISFDKRVSYSKTSMKVRGIGTLVFGAGVETSVATFVDGVVMATGGAGLDDLPDLERIEVLRGPQSTLFGKNASAGAIHLITRTPNREHDEGSLSLRFTDDEEYRVGVNSSGPLSPGLAYRFSAYKRDFEGNVTNLYTGNMINGEATWGTRATLQWDITDNVELVLRGDYSRQDTSNGVRVLRNDSQVILIDPAAIGLMGVPATAGQITGIAGGKNNDRVNLDREPYVDSESSGVAVEINWQKNDHTITNLTAFRNWQQRNERDNDQTQLPFSLSELENIDVDWFSQELRLASVIGGVTDYVVGVYFYRAETHDYSGDTRTFSNAPYRVDFNRVDNTIKNTNAALFGQLNVHPAEGWTLFAGLRQLYDKAEVELSRVANTSNNAYLGDGAVIAVNDVAPLKNSDASHKLIGKIGAGYELHDNVSTYFSYSQGFKGAAFNTSFKFDPDAFINEEPVDPEQSDAYELGVRSQWWDQHLQLNATLHYSTFDGLHLTVRDLQNNRNVLGSVPKAVSKGVEVDFVAILADNFIINGAVSYLDARYTDFSNANCYARQTAGEGCQSLIGGNVQNLSGHRLAYAPEWKMVVGARYQMNGDNFDRFLQLNWRVQSAINLDAAGSPQAMQAGYGIVDLSLGGVSKNQRYSGKLFVKNLLDKQYVSGVGINGNAGGDLILQLLPRDFKRYFGAELSWRF